MLIFIKNKPLKINKILKVHKYHIYNKTFLIVISENIFSKYIENDNSKVELILTKIIVIYSKFIKRKKLIYFLKYKANILLKKANQKDKNKKKNISLKKINMNKNNVHDRLFNDSILKQEMLDNLLNKYLIDEEEKYPFYPKINNYYINEKTDRNIILSERNLRPKSYNNNLSSNDFSSYFSKYIQNTRIRKGLGANSTSSFSCSNLNYNYSDLNDLYYDNNNYRYIPINKKIEQFKKSSIPISTKYKNKLYNSLFKEEDKDDIFKGTYSNSNKYSLNKTTNSFYPKLSNGNNKNKNNTNSIPSNINYIISNNDFQKIKKELKKKRDNKNQNNTKKNIILEKNRNIPEKNKKIIHISDSDISLKEELNNINNNINNDIKSKNNLLNNISSINKNNNNTSLNNISSIGGSIKIENENKKEKEKEKNNKINKYNSPDKKEYLFSFGSDLFSIENKNNHSKASIKKSLIEKLQKKNYSSFINDRRNNNNKIINRNNNGMKKNNSSVRTKSNLNSNHISTNFTGNNSLYNINNNNSKNGNEKIKYNKFEMQSTNQYYIINELNEEPKNGLNFETTIQTLSDSKIFDLAKEYMSEDDSLESYRKKNIISNRKKYCSSIYNLENNNNEK